MTGLPAPAALLIGGLIGAVGYGPVRRWAQTFRRTLGDQPQPTGAAREDSRLLAIFVTLHPAPWVLLFGIPFLLYQLTLGSMRMLWVWLTLGMVFGAALAGVAARLERGAARRG